MSAETCGADETTVELTTDHVADDAPQWVADAIAERDTLGELSQSKLMDIDRWLEYPVDICTQCGGGYNGSNRDLWDGPRNGPAVVTRCPHCGAIQ
jgi:hypothetical protein